MRSRLRGAARLLAAALLAAAPAARLQESAPAAAPTIVAQAEAAQSRDVLLIKTAYLYNFLKFVRWPARPAAAALPLCIAGNHELARVAETALRDKRVGEQMVTVTSLPAGAGADDCALVYGGASAEAAAGVLTVGEGRGFVEQGGMVGFVIVNDHVRFFVNLRALRAAGLSADARLLSVAEEVLQ